MFIKYQAVKTGLQIEVATSTYRRISPANDRNRRKAKGRNVDQSFGHRLTYEAVHDSIVLNSAFSLTFWMSLPVQIVPKP